MAGASLASSAGGWPARLTRRLDRLSEGQFALVSFLPAAILIGLIVIPPILAVFGMSVFRIELAKDDNVPFVGVRNYQRLAADTDFLASVPRTLVYAAFTTLLSVPLGLGAALLLNRGFRGSSLLGIAVLLPWAIAPVVTGLFWAFIFDSRIGIVNGVLMGTGLTTAPIPWLQSTATGVAVAVIATAWRSVPLLTVLILAALKTIPVALGRAARMDGASSFQIFRFVTLPAIRNTLLVASILQVIVSLQVFDLLYLLTGGGPGSETTTMNYFIYNTVVLNASFGYSAALAVFLLGVIVACSAVLLYLRLRSSERSVRDDAPDGSATAPQLALAAAAWRSGIGAGSEQPGSGRRIARVRVPSIVGRVALWLGAAVLVFWLLAPIGWIALSSIEPEGAVTTAPPELTTDVSLDKYGLLLADPDWIGSLAVSLEVTVLATAIAIVLGALAAYPLARFRLPGKTTVPGPAHLHPDGARHRPGNPDALHLPEDRPQGHGPCPRPGERRVVAADRGLAASQRLRGRPQSTRIRGPDRWLLAARDTVPSHDSRCGSGHLGGRDPPAHRGLERVPVRGDPRRSQRGHDDSPDQPDPGDPARRGRAAVHRRGGCRAARRPAVPRRWLCSFIGACSPG